MGGNMGLQNLIAFMLGRTYKLICYNCRNKLAKSLNRNSCLKLLNSTPYICHNYCSFGNSYKEQFHQWKRYD